MRSSTGALRNSLTRLGNKRRSAKVLTSANGLKFSVRAVRNQNGDPVSSPKCQAMAARRYSSGSAMGTGRGTSNSEKSPMPSILSHQRPARQPCRGAPGIRALNIAPCRGELFVANRFSAVDCLAECRRDRLVEGGINLVVNASAFGEAERSDTLNADLFGLRLCLQQAHRLGDVLVQRHCPGGPGAESPPTLQRGLHVRRDYLH